MMQSLVCIVVKCTDLLPQFVMNMTEPFENKSCCFFLERLFVRDSSTEDVHTVDQHIVSSRSVST